MQNRVTAEMILAEERVTAVTAERSNGDGVQPFLLTTHPLLAKISSLPPAADGIAPLQPTLLPAEIQALEDLFSRLPKSFSPEQLDLILRAYVVASDAHSAQMRKTGEPYILHPLAVTKILCDLRLDPDTLAAGLLHDVVEDTDYSLDYLRAYFNPEIASLVDGVTKLNRIKELSNMRHTVADEKAESLRKMFLAMVEDVRVVLIKLADRVHNMRTLQGQPDHKRRRIARETLEIFAPLANRLGIWQIKWELEDLSFRYLEPGTYRELSKAMAQKRTERVQWVDEVQRMLVKALDDNGIKAEVNGRPKHIYSIYRKMQRKEVPFEQIYDIHGFRVIVGNVGECYAALGVIHSLWRPIHGEFDDYIANPKDNLYRSLHTAVVGPNGRSMEVQIRTQDMHQLSEFGIAAHWRYKEGTRPNQEMDNKIAWIRQLMEWRQDVTDAQEFVSGMKTDVFQDRVYVFTPKGDVVDLPREATPIDLAYHIHTELGHRCRGAKVNGKLVTLDTTLHSGDQVEIVTAKRGGPSRDWINPNLGYVATQRARAKIRTWFRKQAREQNVAQGRQVLEKELKRLSVTLPFETVAKLCSYENLDDFLAAIGYGDVNSQHIAKQVLDYERAQQELLEDDETILRKAIGPEKSATTIDGISVAGLDGLLAHPAGCCHPVPGDSIVGYVTMGRGVSIHKINCPNITAQIRRKENARLIEVQWGAESSDTFPVSIQVRAYDRAGLLRDVTGLVADEKINMRSAEAVTGMKNNMAMINATLEITNVAQLTRILTRIERLPNVVDVVRKAG
ncbi:MAG TPA: bifunctional (p)ppGpp synthetase/guanosine-3',5'-bis(diphosphate) 3'-pyrophosphohydrolase [Caldilineaceae bacterium]|nr:bifunctional (p)ppGpp synthetase/guanosine-3',5'-bis(diphosphate) 3'-pyrophosphohydrolase [Caldilineaceae bacterium]